MESNIEIVVFPRAISSEIWVELSLAMSQEATILGTRTAPENLARLYADGHALLLMEGDVVVGFIGAWQVAPGFVEIGSAWIRNSHRGRGLGDRLYEEVRRLSVVNNTVAFAVTQNPIALKAGMRAELFPYYDWKYPVPWTLTCGPCDKYATDTDKERCPLRDRSCWLRIRRTR